VNAILEMKGITKRFPGVVALKDVNLAVQPGEIHAICGENGAGKSTLMKVLSGVYPHGTYEGDIRFEGNEQRFESIRDSEDKGIAIIHQELALVPLMSIAENIFLGNELSRKGVIDNEATHRRAAEAGRARRFAGGADHQSRRRQAATGRDCKGACQGMQTADTRRADCQPQ